MRPRKEPNNQNSFGIREKSRNNMGIVGTISKLWTRVVSNVESGGGAHKPYQFVIECDVQILSHDGAKLYRKISPGELELNRALYDMVE